MSDIVVTRGGKGLMFMVVAQGAIKPSDSPSESSISPYDGAPTPNPSGASEVIAAVLIVASSFSFFTTIASP
jgi:hypothetical protein